MSHKKAVPVIGDTFWNILVLRYVHGACKFNGTKWKAHFGISFSSLKILWFTLANNYNENNTEYHLQPKHLIWTLYWLKVCSTWHTTTSFTKCDVKTAHLWIWRLIKLIPKCISVKIIFSFFSFSQNKNSKLFRGSTGKSIGSSSLLELLWM